MAKMTVRRIVDMPGDYKPYVFQSMNGSDGPGIHLDFIEEDGTQVSVRIPVTKALITRLRDSLQELNTGE